MSTSAADPRCLCHESTAVHTGGGHVSTCPMAYTTDRTPTSSPSEPEHAAWVRDIEAAAGELAVPVPQPGTDMARLLIANILLRRENAALRAPSEPEDDVDDEPDFTSDPNDPTHPGWEP